MSLQMNDYNFELDIRGEGSPYPLFRTKSLIDKLQKGDILKIIIDNPVAHRDINMWIKESGNELLKVETSDDTYTIFIRKV